MARNKSNTRRRKAAHKRPVYGYCVRVTCDVHVGGHGAGTGVPGGRGVGTGGHRGHRQRGGHPAKRGTLAGGRIAVTPLFYFGGACNISTTAARASTMHQRSISRRKYDITLDEVFPYELRFWSRVRIGGPDECWPYGYVDSDAVRTGYGQFSICGCDRPAHCVAYVLCKGDVLCNHIVRHTCDNPPCCNPSHLILGSQHDNMQDMVARGRRQTY